jgi:uncharacterized protein
MPSGRILSLHRWPVKSMAGERLPALQVDGRGAIGDRARAVFDLDRGRLLTAREAPRLLAWRARLEGDEALVRGPDGTERGWSDPHLGAALAADLGREIRLDRDDHGMQDLGETVLVTTQASLDALPEPWRDLRRYRTNLHVDGPEAWAEERWEGRRMVAGEVELELLHPCERCAIPTRDPDTQRKDGELSRWLAREHDLLFGINARVVRAGTVREGDPVSVL